PTTDDIPQARVWQKPRLIFVKKTDDHERDEPLQLFLAELADMDAGRASHWFSRAAELGEFVKTDVARWQAGLVRRFTESSFAGPFQVEALSDQYVERRDLLERAKALWLPGG